MRENVQKLEYTRGMFDVFKKEKDISKWKTFPDIMWGLGFEMDSEVSFFKYVEEQQKKPLSHMKEEEEKAWRIQTLKEAPLDIVGNQVFSEWRYYTYWAGYIEESDHVFVHEILLVLERKLRGEL